MTLHELILRFGGFFSKPRRERELEEEIENHLLWHSQSCQGSKFRSFRIEAPELVAVQDERGSDMNKIVSAEPMLGSVAQSEFLEFRLQFGRLDVCRTKKSPFCQIRLESCVGSRGLFGSNANLSRLAGGVNMELQRVDNFHPMQPRNGQRPAAWALCFLHQIERLNGIRKPEIEPRKEICICVNPHSPAISLSAIRVCARERGFGNSFVSRARKSGTAVIRSGPASGRIVYVRPFRRRILAPPSRSDASNTALGTRSSSRTVKVFITDNLSALAACVNWQKRMSIPLQTRRSSLITCHSL